MLLRQRIFLKEWGYQLGCKATRKKRILTFGRPFFKGGFAESLTKLHLSSKN